MPVWPWTRQETPPLAPLRGVPSLELRGTSASGLFQRKSVFNKIHPSFIRYLKEAVCLDCNQCVIFKASRHVHQWLYFRKRL